MAVNIFTSSSLTSWSETWAYSWGLCDRSCRWDTPWKKKQTTKKKHVLEVGIVTADDYLPIKSCRGWQAGGQCCPEWGTGALLFCHSCYCRERGVWASNDCLKKNLQQAAQRERKYQGFPNKPPIGCSGFQHKRKKIRLQESVSAAMAAPPQLAELRLKRMQKNPTKNKSKIHTAMWDPFTLNMNRPSFQLDCVGSCAGGGWQCVWENFKANVFVTHQNVCS